MRAYAAHRIATLRDARDAARPTPSPTRPAPSPMLRAIVRPAPREATRRPSRLAFPFAD